MAWKINPRNQLYSFILGIENILLLLFPWGKKNRLYFAPYDALSGNFPFEEDKKPKTDCASKSVNPDGMINNDQPSRHTDKQIVHSVVCCL